MDTAQGRSAGAEALARAARAIGLPDAEAALLADAPELVERLLAHVERGTHRAFLDRLDWEALAAAYERRRLGPRGGPRGGSRPRVTARVSHR